MSLVFCAHHVCTDGILIPSKISVQTLGVGQVWNTKLYFVFFITYFYSGKGFFAPFVLKRTNPENISKFPERAFELVLAL